MALVIYQRMILHVPNWGEKFGPSLDLPGKTDQRLDLPLGKLLGFSQLFDANGKSVQFHILPNGGEFNGDESHAEPIHKNIIN